MTSAPISPRPSDQNDKIAWLRRGVPDPVKPDWNASGEVPEERWSCRDQRECAQNCARNRKAYHQRRAAKLIGDLVLLAHLTVHDPSSCHC